MRNRWIVGIAVIAPVAMVQIAGAPIVRAQPAGAAPTLEECRAIQDGQARLACYDGLAAAPPPRPAAQEEPRQRQERNFGLAEERKPRAERAEVDELRAKIAAVRPGASGKVVELDNGQVWRITSSGRLQDWLEEGQTVTISRGTLSGYRLRADKVTGMETVRRVR